MELHSLDDILEKRILRVPDYQRGYAWGIRQINDFWEDISRLDDNKIHYTGVVTLEPVQVGEWIIGGQGYRPSYVVDGQQRLVTSMILLQAMIEKIEKLNDNRKDNEKEVQLHDQSVNQIRNKYILHKAEDGLKESFLFGYEKDDPSDEFLRTRIFKPPPHSDSIQETLYTRNLDKAKNFFSNKLENVEVEEISALFKKLTQKLKFNLYEIDDEMDASVIFETMNYRGKSLTNLELLKNRLIYLSTLFTDTDNAGREELRGKINKAWKTIYEYLGKNPKSPLDDDEFLRNHWIMYFKYTRQKGRDYSNFLLDEKFTVQNVVHPKSGNDKLTVEYVNSYVTSLQESARPWFYIHNPYYSEWNYPELNYPGLTEYTDEENKILLDRLQKLNSKAFKPLILAAFVSKKSLEDTNRLLWAAERYSFTLFILSQRKANIGESAFYKYAKDVLEGRTRTSIIPVIGNIDKLVGEHYDPDKFLELISDNYKSGKIGKKDGFYGWDGLRYFLFEYEQSLEGKGKEYNKKLLWDSLSKDFRLVGHIFPQASTDPYWQEHFSGFSKQKKLNLTHSLGNLLLLSRPENPYLQNDSFDKKKDNGDGTGYCNGSVSENEVARYEDWTADSIKERGLELLAFMEERWEISLGNETFKLKLLHLNFLS